MKDIPCVIWTASAKKTNESLNLLCDIAATYNFSLETISNYSSLIAHTYDVFNHEGYTKEEILKCLSEKNKRYNYCQDHEKKNQNFIQLCSICTYNKNYSDKQEKYEKIILYYLLDQNFCVNQLREMGNNMFVCKKIIKPTGKYGKWPIIAFYKEIYDFIFINFITGQTVDINNFLEKFMQHMYARIPFLTKEFKNDEKDIKDSLYSITKIFIGGYRKIHIDEFEEVLKAITKQYEMFHQKAGTTSINTKQTLQSEKLDKDLSVPEIDESRCKISNEILHELTNVMKVKDTHSKSKQSLQEIKVLSDIHIESKKSRTNKDERKTKTPNKAAMQDLNKWFTQYPLPLNEKDIKTLSLEWMAPFHIMIIRAEYVVIEVSVLKGQTGFLFYPHHSEDIFFITDISMIRNTISWIQAHTKILCFDIVKLCPLLHKNGINIKRQIESISDLYNSYTSNQDKDFEIMTTEVLGMKLFRLNAVLQGEWRLFQAMTKYLTNNEQKSLYGRIISFQRALSYSYTYDNGKIIKLTEYAEKNNVILMGIRVEIKGYGKWQELLYTVMGKLWKNGALDSFKLHLKEYGESHAVFQYLSSRKDELLDLLCHTFHASLENSESDIYNIHISVIEK